MSRLCHNVSAAVWEQPQLHQQAAGAGNAAEVPPSSAASSQCEDAEDRQVPWPNNEGGGGNEAASSYIVSRDDMG